MRIEHDEEATSFDPRPWGAQQRVLPRSHFSARMSGTLQETSIPQIPGLTPVRTIPPLPVPVAARAVTPLAVPVVFAPVQPPYMPAISFAPLAMPAFTAPVDSTIRVHRSPLTLRSFIAVPIGALIAIVVIAVGYRASTVRSPSAAVAAASVQRASVVEAPMLVASVAIAPNTPDPIEGVATFDAPLAVERTIPADAKAMPTKSSRRKHRPRKIVAVDSSTPLGNLRPRRY